MPDFILQNWKLKLTSLVLAYLTWMLVNQVTGFEKVFDEVPLVVLTDEGWALREQSTDVVEVDFRGSRDDINRLKSEEIKVEVNLKGTAFKETQVLELTPRNVRTTGGAAQPFEVRPRIIKIRLDQEAKRSVPIRANLVGELPAGYELEKIELDPELLPVKGSRVRLEALDYLLTDPIELAGKTKSFESRVSVVAPFAGAVLERGKVLVKVSLLSNLKQREWESVPVALLLPPGFQGRFSAEPPHVFLKLEGGVDAIDQLQPEALDVFVRPDPKPGIQKIPVKFSFPAGITMIDIQPRTIKVSLDETAIPKPVPDLVPEGDPTPATPTPEVPPESP